MKGCTTLDAIIHHELFQDRLRSVAATPVSTRCTTRGFASRDRRPLVLLWVFD